MQTTRLFISLSIESAQAKEILLHFKALAIPWDKIKPTMPEQLHLTIKWLGDTKIEHIPDVITALEKINSGLDWIDLKITKATIFNNHNPKILALALAPDPKLQQLYQAIEESLFTAGLSSKDERQFKPHLTLGRIKKKTTLAELEPFTKWHFKANSFNVSHFELMESILSKSGPTYNILQTFDF